MPLPRLRRGETVALILKPNARLQPFRARTREYRPLMLLGAGLLLMTLALVESARAASPPRPPLPSDAQRMTAAELKVLTAHPASYRNRDSADPTTYSLRPDGTLTVYLNQGKEVLDGKWSIEADQLCIRLGWFYKSCSDAWRLGETSYFFWGEDEDETSGLARNTYDRLR